jgi:hypothetical protein
MSQATRPRPATDESTAFAVLLGAVVTVVTSFVPLSPILGGAVAAYLRRGGRREGARVGALSGAVAAVPALALAALAFGGLSVVATAVGAAGGTVVLGALLLVATGLLVTAVVGLGALGGYLGAVLVERRAADVAEPTAEPAPADLAVPADEPADAAGWTAADAEPVGSDEGAAPAPDVGPVGPVGAGIPGPTVGRAADDASVDPASDADVAVGVDDSTVGDARVRVL